MGEIVGIVEAIASTSSAATNVGMAIAESIKQKLHYKKHYKEIVKNAKSSIEQLDNSVKDKKDGEGNGAGGKMLTRRAYHCLQEVETLKKEIEDLIVACEETNHGAKLGKKADKAIIKIKDLQDKFDNLSHLYCQPQPSYSSRVEKLCYEYGSMKEGINKVIRALKDDNCRIIGVVGTGGIGKSTLLDQIGRRMETEKMFDIIIGVDLSNKPSEGEIQENIADGLKYKFSSNNIIKRSEELTVRIRSQKVLIMLDSVWTALDFQEIGIPNTENDRECKVLIATRNAEVCRGFNEQIRIDFLSEKDSWDFFKRKASVLDEFFCMAKDVVEECNGLLLALDVMATVLNKVNDERIWCENLRDLRQSNPGCDPLKQKLFKSLKLSYDHLNNESGKLLFLLCCLFPEGHEISEDELTWYAIGMDIIPSFNNLEILRQRIHTWVITLKDHCLLSTKNVKTVEMHDVVRDVAVYIASNCEKFFIEACSDEFDMKDRDTKEIFENCEKISITGFRLSKLPEEPSSQQLKLLLLGQDPKLRNGPTLSDKFFKQMTKLTILDLSDTSILKLPYSMNDLGNLRVLLLNGCKKLSEISVHKTWKKLKILSMRGCSITSIPKGIKEIVTLKFLDLSSIYLNRKIPPKTLEGVSSLEEIHLDVESINNNILIEIAALTKLTGLQLHIKDPNVFSGQKFRDCAWKNLKSYIFYSDKSLLTYATPNKKQLLIKRVDSFEDWVKTLFSETDDLVLDNCFWRVTPLLRLAEQDKEKEFKQLKTLRLKRCDGISHLLRSEDNIKKNAFSNLEELNISGLENLNGITEGPLPSKAFKSVKGIHLEACKNIRTLMPYYLLVNVQQKLEVLDVINCEEVCCVFEFSEANIVSPSPSPMFPKLKIIKLYKLPKITVVNKGVVPKGSFESLKEIHIQGCDILEYLFWGSICNGLKCLEKLVVANCCKMEEIIKNDEPLDEDTFPRLTDLEITDIPELKHFYKEDEEVMIFSWPLLQIVTLGSCLKLKRLPIGENSARKLKNIKLKDKDDFEWFKELEWEGASSITECFPKPSILTTSFDCIEDEDII